MLALALRGFQLVSLCNRKLELYKENINKTGHLRHYIVEIISLKNEQRIIFKVVFHYISFCYFDVLSSILTLSLQVRLTRQQVVFSRDNTVPEVDTHQYFCSMIDVFRYIPGLNCSDLSTDVIEDLKQVRTRTFYFQIIQDVCLYPL